MIRSEKRRASFLAIIIAAIMLFPGFSLTGCGVAQSEQNQQPAEKGSGILDTTLDLVDQGKTLWLDFSLKNISDQELSLLFGSGHQYDIIVTDAGGQEVYNWATGKAFTYALINSNLAPGQELSYHEDWDYTDTEGNPLPPGKYSVKVIMLPIENKDIIKVRTEDLTVVKEIEIK